MLESNGSLIYGHEKSLDHFPPSEIQSPRKRLASYPGLSPLLEDGARRVFGLVFPGKTALLVSRLFEETHDNDTQDDAGESDTIL